MMNVKELIVVMRAASVLLNSLDSFGDAWHQILDETGNPPGVVAANAMNVAESALKWVAQQKIARSKPLNPGVETGMSIVFRGIEL